MHMMQCPLIKKMFLLGSEVLILLAGSPGCLVLIDKRPHSHRPSMPGVQNDETLEMFKKELRPNQVM